MTQAMKNKSQNMSVSERLLFAGIGSAISTAGAAEE